MSVTFPDQLPKSSDGKDEYLDDDHWDMGDDYWGDEEDDGADESEASTESATKYVFHYVEPGEDGTDGTAHSEPEVTEEDDFISQLYPKKPEFKVASDPWQVPHEVGKTAIYLNDDRDYLAEIAAIDLGPRIRKTPDAGIHLSDEEARDPANIVAAIEKQHYARVTADFSEQAEETDRNNTFQYSQTVNDELITLTEHEGLAGLRESLAEMIEKGEAVVRRGGGTDVLVAEKTLAEHIAGMKDLYDNLTFIGDEEMTEGSAGIGMLWKDYLDQDPRNVLCVPTLLTNNNPYGERKSDAFLLGRVLDTFTDEELEAYKGRIISDPFKLAEDGVDPDHAKLVYLDDWTISGAQMSTNIEETAEPQMADYFKTVYNDELIEPEKYLRSVEMNLIVADSKLLEYGFKIRTLIGLDGLHGVRVPVKAYYRSHDTDPDSPYRIRQSGTHSSVDYGYQNDIRDAIAALYDAGAIDSMSMPPLTNIKRAYRTEPPLVTIGSDGTLIRTEKVAA